MKLPPGLELGHVVVAVTMSLIGGLSLSAGPFWGSKICETLTIHVKLFYFSFLYVQPVFQCMHFKFLVLLDLQHTTPVSDLERMTFQQHVHIGVCSFYN